MKRLWLILFVVFIGCAGSGLNPYLTDMYGNKKHLVNDGATLVEVKKDLTTDDTYHFRFYENAVASSYEIELNKQNTITNYYSEFALKNGYKNFVEQDITLQTGYMNSYWHKVRFSKVEGLKSKIFTNYNNRNIYKEVFPSLLGKALDAYEEYKSEGDYSSPSTSFGTGGNKGCNIYGKIKFVEYGEDYKVRFVDYGENLKVKYVEYGEDSKGNWKMVEFGEDYKLKIVSYGEDFTVKTVSYGQGCN
jgi:hypothetical protein